MNLLGTFQELDETLAQRWRALSCHELAAMYEDFTFGVKELVGNAENFVGLTELTENPRTDRKPEKYASGKLRGEPEVWSCAAG